LGSASAVDSIVVHWPSGAVDHIGAQHADQQLVIQEGKGVVNQQPLSLRKELSGTNLK
jgi:hypothetical protein